MTATLHQVTALPGTPAVDAFYMVLANPGDAFVEFWATDAAGTLKQIVNTAGITTVVNGLLAAQSSIFQVVADNTARDTYFTGAANKLALVVDATSDPLVDAGAAFYGWDGTSALFISELESQNISLNWTDIAAGPASTPAQLDAAVAATHTHANKTELDLIGANGAIPQYNGVDLMRVQNAW